ncbi:MAG: DUF945 family protein [Arenicellales bacterium]|nr:DUF945 family protein [Arenicellales bacterium]
MKRILFITVLIALVVVAAATPYWFGVEAERIYQQQIDALESNNKITVIENSFQRGWLSSDAGSRVSIDGTPAVILAEHTIEHGPIPSGDPLKYIASLQPLQALIHSRLSLQSRGQQNENLVVGTLLTIVSIDGTTHTQINIPAADVQMNQSANLLWEHIAGHVDFVPNESSWQGVITTDGIAWQQGDTDAQVGSSELDFFSYPGSTGLALGNSALTIDSMRAHLPGSQGYLTATGLTFESTATERGPNVSYSVDGKIVSADLHGLKINSGDWSARVENLDLDSLTRLNEMEVGAAIPLNDLVGLLSKRNAKAESSFKLGTDSGPFTADARITFSDSGGSNNPLMLLSTVDGSVDVDMPATIVEMIARSRPTDAPAEMSDAAVAARIQSWLDNNFLTRFGDRYRFRATIANGAVKLNGKPFNFMSLFR